MSNSYFLSFIHNHKCFEYNLQRRYTVFEKEIHRVEIIITILNFTSAIPAEEQNKNEESRS